MVVTEQLIRQNQFDPHSYPILLTQLGETLIYDGRIYVKIF